jgi:hypothetical protein
MAYTVAPGARILWCLRRRSTDVRCVLCAGGRPAEVLILQDRDAVLRETFPEESAALAWAREYADSLRARGWRDRPEDHFPSSAA